MALPVRLCCCRSSPSRREEAPAELATESMRTGLEGPGEEGTEEEISRIPPPPPPPAAPTTPLWIELLRDMDCRRLERARLGALLIRFSPAGVEEEVEEEGKVPPPPPLPTMPPLFVLPLLLPLIEV